MPRLNRKKSILVSILTSIILLGTLITASAQAGRFVIISPPDFSEFPLNAIYFDVSERDGSLVTDLKEDQLSIRENGVQQEILHFAPLNPGIQLVTAFNISPPFAIQDISGKSRFDYIQETLLTWADNIPNSAPDNLSLISNDGLEVTHLEERTAFSETLQDYIPALQDSEANLNVLAKAIEVASDPVDQLGMKRVVLFFTPPVPIEGTAVIESIISRASENQVRVYVVLVSSPAFFNSAGAEALNRLAEETGGYFVTYVEEVLEPESEEEEDLPPQPANDPLPDFVNLFSALRNTYILQYQSQIITPGTHSLELAISSPLGESLGQREFFLDVQPPNPIFISPPQVITREMIQTDDDPISEQSLKPDTVELDMIIEFPDGHPRDLEEVIFRVDGEIVARMTSPPYNLITWDLTPYQSNGVHALSLEAVDMLGLNRQSLSTPIEIQINIPPLTVGSVLEKNALEISGLVTLLALGFLLFVLITKGKVKPIVYLGRNRFFNKNGNAETGSELQKISEDNKKSDAPPKLEWGYRLVPISDVAQQLIPEPIQVWEKEILFGNDPNLGDYQINHSSVSESHTRISIDRDGDVSIKDEGGAAGTWINYEQILSKKPQPIKDGDIIHIGEAGFRFQVLETKFEPPTIEEKHQ